jgi:DNA polymerase III alpha subunit (gram-positive type)
MYRQSVNRQKIIDYARSKISENPVYLDTETTGLEATDEIIEIAIIDTNGFVIYESFIRPTKIIPAAVTDIHHITNEMVQNSPTWEDQWLKIREILVNHAIGMYNAEFDLRMIQQTLAAHKIPLQDKLNAFDVMKIYSDFEGNWDSARRRMKRYRLEDAGRNMGIPLPNSHRAVDDTKLTRALFHAIAGLPYQGPS